MRVLVTGGAGYIGSHACKALSLKGMEPVVLDNLVYGHAEFVKWGPLVEGSIQDRGLVEAVLDEYEIEAIMHFAGFAYVGESVEYPAKYYVNNVAGSISLLEAARRTGVRQVVFSSSCATYGVPSVIPIPEEHPKAPINPYGKTKLAIEEMLKDYGAAYGLKSVSLRYFNAAGADPEGELGEDHDPETHLIPRAFDAALGRTGQMTINGTDYPTPDGTCIRDFIHVTDLADAHVKALEYLANGGEPTAFNLGNSRGYSIREVFEAVKKVTGMDFRAVEGARRPGDPPELAGSPEKAQKVLGWAQRYSDLDTIIGHAWAWHRKRFG